MKLAEALILRADAQKRIEQLRTRLARSAKVQEGEQPPENPQELLVELRNTITQFKLLIQRINRTNALTPFANDQTLTDALAERDALMQERNVLSTLVGTSTEQQYRYSRSEVKYFSTVSIAEIQKQMDDLSRRYRELDSAIELAGRCD